MVHLSYITPGGNDQRYVRNINGESQYVQKWYLLWSLIELLEIANGSSIIDDVTETFKRSFDKVLKFRQIYELTKCHREYVYNKGIPQSTCLCDICKDSIYLVKGINAKLSKAEQLPTNPNNSVEKY